MLIAAVLIWAFYVLMLALCLRYALSAGRVALVAVVVVLTILTAFRPVIFFLGLDNPLPQSHFEQSEWTMVTIALLVMCAWLGMLMGFYALHGGTARAVSFMFPKGPVAAYDKGRKLRGIWFVIAFPAVFGVGGSLYLIAKMGGVAELVYASKVGKDLAGLFIFKEAVGLAILLCLFGLFASLRRGRDGRMALTAQSWLFVASVVFLMGVSYTWGGRYAMALTMLTGGVAWHLYVRSISLGQAALLGVLAMALMQALKSLRLVFFSEVTGGAASYENTNVWADLSNSLHFVEFDALMLALRDSGVLFEFRQGQDFINGLLSWVPRFVFPEKDTFHIGGWFRRVYQPDIRNGWPVTVVGAWYINFGWIGIALGAYVSALFIRAMDTAFSAVRTNPWHATMGAGFAFFMLEGGVNTGFPQRIFLMLIPLALAAFYLRLCNAPAQQRRGRSRPVVTTHKSLSPGE